ncbi:MAG: helix-turn-helix domain-containing protein [Phycisphaerales bacterium]|nr:helix-turn-helix domain-containing protein [Phycisphaerales bacterium]
MTTQVQSSDGRTVNLDPRPNIAAEMLDVRAVSTILGGCSIRHIHRMADSGKMPRPVKLGALVRWRRIDLEQWIAARCPVQQPGAHRS